MGLCANAGLFELSSPCIRDSWAALVPCAFVFLVCITIIPPPAIIRRVLDVLKTPFRPFLTLREAEILNTGEKIENVPQDEASAVPLWRTLVLSLIALTETLAWLALGSYHLVIAPEDIWSDLRPFAIALSWLYATCRPVICPTATPPFDLFAFYFLRVAGDVLSFGGELYDHTVMGDPLPAKWVIAFQVVNLVAGVVLLLVVLSMPLDVPSSRVNPEDIVSYCYAYHTSAELTEQFQGKSVSPDDYTSLWGWMSFLWVKPLIDRGTYETLNEDDVWALSATMQARPVYAKFSECKKTSLLRWLWAANSLDLILDFSLTFVSVVFNYLGPFFLKRILDSLGRTDNEQERVERISQAYIYAFLAFLCILARAEADVQHLWFGRRAATRMRTSLMTAIYDKALKRKDFSGVIDKDSKAKMDVNNSKADDPKAGADVGKIVNLMAGDASRVRRWRYRGRNTSVHLVSDCRTHFWDVLHLWRYAYPLLFEW